MNVSNCKYDVVISFERTEIDIAVALSLALEQKGLKAYFYPYSQEENLGVNLKQSLSKIYEFEGVVAIGIFTKAYFEKEYTSIEFSAIQRRLSIQQKYLIPLLLNEKETYHQIEGLTYCVWKNDPKHFADIVFEYVGNVFKKASFLSHYEIAIQKKEILLQNIQKLQRFQKINNESLFLQLGWSYYYLNQSETDLQYAEQYFRRAVACNSVSHQACFWLSKTIILRKKLHRIKHKDLQEPIAYLKKAMQLQFGNRMYKAFAKEIEEDYFNKYGLRSPF